MTGSSDVSIFALPLDEPSLGLFTWILCSLIVFTLVIEHLIEYLDHHLSAKTAKLLQKLKDELMILGLISFILALISQSGIHFDEMGVITFEFTHLLLFFVALALITHTIKLILVEAKQAREWSRLNSKVLNKEELSSLIATMQNEDKSFFSKFKNLLGFVSKARAQGEFALCKTIFYSQHNIAESCPEFDFTIYLIMSLERTTLSVLHVGPMSWYVIIAFAVVNYLFHLLDSSVNPDSVTFGSILFCLFGIAFILVDIVVLVMLRREIDLYLDQVVELSGNSWRVDSSKHLSQGKPVRVVPVNDEAKPISYTNSASQHEQHNAHAQTQTELTERTHSWQFRFLKGFLKTSSLIFAFYTASFVYFHIYRATLAYAGRIPMMIFVIFVMFVPIVLHMWYFDGLIISNWTILSSLHIHDNRVYERVGEYIVEERMQYDKIRAVFMLTYDFDSTSDIKRNEEKLRAIFQKYDTSGDMKLNKKEFEAFCHELCGEHTSKERIAAYWKAVSNPTGIAFFHESNENLANKDVKFITFEAFQAFVIGKHGHASSTQNVISRQILSNTKPKNVVQNYKSIIPVHAFRVGQLNVKTFEKHFSAVNGEKVVLMTNRHPISCTCHECQYDMDVISEEILKKDYNQMPGDPSKYLLGNELVAVQMDEPFEIAAHVEGQEGVAPTILQGKAGDYIVNPNTQHARIVNAAAFERAYKLSESNESEE